MDPWVSSQSAFLAPFFIIFLVSIEVPGSFCSYDFYRSCSNPFNCGDITDVGYPFWGDGRPDGCGNPKLKLNCPGNITTIEMMQMEYRVLGFNENSQTLRIARPDYMSGICSPEFVNTTLDSEVFDYGGGYSNITVSYGCPSASSTLVSCSIKGLTTTGVSIQHGALGPGLCAKSVVFPVLQAQISDLTNWSIIEDAIKEGFEVKWKEDTAACGACTESKGVCGYDLSTNETTCYCPNQSMGSTCSPSTNAPPKKSGLSRYENIQLYLLVAERSSKQTMLTRVLLPILIFVVVLISFVIIYMKRLHFPIGLMMWERDIKHDHLNMEEIMKNFGSIGPKRYTYLDVKKLTNSFKEKVGQGGYGIVYKGKLLDGRVVAVKILNESKGNGEEFINEVASISRTSHINIVTLLGFCYERSKRALIYEFIANGSLDKLIYDKRSSIPNSHLDKKTMFQIAIGIARGLEYLHRGCNTRILHFDIKPHNILLDEDWCPKISDFGLAKLCKPKESIVSMTGMRGTPGYIAPEVFNPYFGRVSHKSDVYSYGMLVLEMNGVRKITNIRDSHSSEAYFPNGIYDKLEQGESFGNVENLAEEEEDIIKKMIIVSLWCIQMNPSNRPSMGKVIEMLEGTLQSLQVPLKPSFDLLDRPCQDSSTNSLSQNLTFQMPSVEL